MKSTNNLDYLMNCLTDSRMEWLYRLQLFWSGVKDMLLDQPYTTGPTGVAAE